MALLQAFGKGARARPASETQPAKTHDRQLAADHDRALAKLTTLKLKLEAALERLAGLQAELDGARAELKGADTKTAALTRDIFRLNKRIGRMATENDYLHRYLKWCWTSYPGSDQAWRERPQGSDPARDRADHLRARLVAALAEPSPSPPDLRVTAVVTSCRRHDLLAQTLDSFFAANTCPVERLIVVEDGDEIAPGAVRSRFAGQPVDWISTGGRVGQIHAIDRAYAQVLTPYIFHFEDDWEFVRGGFIEGSLAILQAEPLCLQVSLRGAPAPGAEASIGAEHASGGVAWRRLMPHLAIWRGFSFNPGLKRLRDYRLLGSYAAFVDSRIGSGALAEGQLSELYGDVGFFGAALWSNGGERYVRHLGRGRHVD